jgi:hypothetical protein
MVVSLADDVALTSAAPNPSLESQAAIAPTLADEPAPPEVVEREVTPRREPEARTPRATRAAPERRSEPAPRRTSGGSRIGDDFLAGDSAGQSRTRGTPAEAFGPAEQASLAQAINRQLKPHWAAPSGVDAELLVTVLSWRLKSDGSLDGRPVVVSQSGITDSNRPQAQLHAERAIRAVQLAAPFDLPPQFYDKWKRVAQWRFDRKL